MRVFLPGDSVPSLLTCLASRMEVIAPVEVSGAPVFASWSGQPLALAENPLISPVEFFLPMKEVLFRYEQDCGRYTFKETSARPRMIFGIRPCDIAALKVLDRIFGSDPADHPYFDKRRSTVLVALNCINPSDGCFCSAFGSGPDCGAGFDLALTEIGSGYLVETGSPAGVLILREHPQFFLEASVSQLLEKGDIMKRTKEGMDAKNTHTIAQIKEAIERADWKALGRECLNCGSCTFVCPVCHCFTIVDRGVPDGERMRCRDTCLLSGFSRMAGGGNPRTLHGERLQNWYRDKFEYIPQNTGLLGCVGCGRCARACLAEMDRWSLKVKR